jgi:hypothetical protein
VLLVFFQVRLAWGVGRWFAYNHSKMGGIGAYRLFRYSATQADTCDYPGKTVEGSYWSDFSPAALKLAFPLTTTSRHSSVLW